MGNHEHGSMEWQSLLLTTGLSTGQLEQLHQRFVALDWHQKGYLTSIDLLRIPELVQNPLHRQVIDAFTFGGTDKDATAGKDRVDFRQFVGICATFMTPQFSPISSDWARDRKLQMLCSIIDVSHCGRIRREDFRKIMLHVLGDAPSTDMQLLEDQVFQREQQDISYEQFQQLFDSSDMADRMSIDKWLE